MLRFEIYLLKNILETSTKETKIHLNKYGQIIFSEEDDFTCVKFVADLKKFKIYELDDDTIALLAIRAYEIAARTPGAKLFINDKRLPVNKFEDYCKLNLSSELDIPVKLIYKKFADRWEVAVA